MKAYFRENRGEFLELVKRGPPPQFRWLAWQTLIGDPYIEEDYMVYLELGKMNASMMREIEKDINRTFASQPYFSDSKHGDIG